MKKIILSAGRHRGPCVPYGCFIRRFKARTHEIMLITDIRVEKYINNLNIKFKLVDASKSILKKKFYLWYFYYFKNN